MTETPVKQSISFSLAVENSPLSEVTAAYIEMGKGPVLLFLHGFSSDATIWSTITLELQQSFRCICLDLLGFGGSSQLEGIDYRVESQVLFATGFMTAMGIDHTFLVGHSLGGWITASLAIAMPEAVSGIVLLAPAGVAEDLPRFSVLKPLSWETSIIDGLLNLSAPIARFLRQEVAIAQLRFIRQQFLTDPVFQAWMARAFRLEISDELVTDAIQDICAPTLIIAGAKDEMIPLWHCEYYHSKIPEATIEILLEADHLLPTRNSGTITPMIYSFIDGVESDDCRSNPSELIQDCPSRLIK
ncbi:MAG: alpha/beta fold hydrolase [Thermosynechococcaceae cyanobacterium]